MPWINTPGGGVAHVKMSKPRRNLCCSCRAYATLQCDWPKDGGGTCDKSVCRTCARNVGPDRDYCPFHRGEPALTEAEGIAAGEAEAQKAADMFGIKR